MAKRVRLQVAVLMAGAAFIAGCGAESSTPATSSTPRRATTGSAPISTGSRLAVELSTCSSTAARSRLSASGKARFLSLCRHAVNGADASVTRTAAQQCAHIIKQTVPAAAQADLIAGCPKS
jgi:hypothetical protein